MYTPFELLLARHFMFFVHISYLSIHIVPGQVWRLNL